MDVPFAGAARPVRRPFHHVIVGVIRRELMPVFTVRDLPVSSDMASVGEKAEMFWVAAGFDTATMMDNPIRWNRSKSQRVS